MIKYILSTLTTPLPKIADLRLMVEHPEHGRKAGYEKEYHEPYYLHKYGSTLRGLMIHQNIEPADYLEYVHDVGVEERLSPNPDLIKLLTTIPCERAIFTSGHRPHALKVLRCLGVESFFPQIFDIVFTRYIPKPNPEPYEQVLECIGRRGKECLMVEDIPANLKPAKDLGMTTVLVGETPGGVNGFVDHEIREILQLRQVLDLSGFSF
jgi:putative hydrolase of the HAD superfamily